MEEKKIKRCLLLIFLLAVFLRIGFIMTLDNTVDVWGDWWDELGWKLAQGKGFWVANPYFADGPPFYSWRAPGFPFFLAIIYKVFGHSFLAAKIGLAVISSVTGLLLYFLAALLTDPKTGLISALIYAVYPAAIFWTGYLAPETLTAFLMVVTVVLAVAAVKRRNPWVSFGAGLFLGCAVLTRSAVLLLVPAIPLYFFFQDKKCFPRMFAAFCGGLCILLLWVARNHAIHKKFVLVSTEGGVVFYIANNEFSLSQPSGFYHAENTETFRGLSETEIDVRFYQMGLDFIRRHPGVYCQLVADRFLRFWRLFPHTISGPGESYSLKHVVISAVTETPVIIFGLLGLGMSLVSKRRKQFVLFYWVIFSYSTSYILVRTAIRYRFPLMGFLIVFAAIFFHRSAIRGEF